MRQKRAFARLWTAATISAYGDGIRTAALPLLAAATPQGPEAVSIVTAAGFLAWPIFGLIGGAYSDRYERRLTMAGVNLVRCVLVGTLALSLFILGPATVALMAILAFVLGVGETVYDNAAVGLLPEIVDRGDLGKANSGLLSGQLTGTQLVGPVLGSILFSLGPSVPFFTDAATFAVSVSLLVGLPRTARPTGGIRSSLWSQIRTGLNWLVKNATLRAMAVASLALGASTGALLATLVIYSREQLRLPSTLYGVLLAAFAVGSISGALLAPKVIRLFSTKAALMGSICMAAASFAALSVTSNVVAVMVSLAVLGFAASTWNVASVTTRQRLTPNELLGRVSGAYRTLTLTFTAVGAAISGLVTASFGSSLTFALCSVLAVIAFLLAFAGLNKVD